MLRPRRWFVLACVFLAPLAVSPPARAEDKAEEKWLLDRALTVSPQAAPVPALQYRLYPLSSERKEGNAVPMYLRFAHERNDATKKELVDTCNKWNALPLNEIPLAEARKFLDRWSYNLKQMELGARRKTAEWNYAFDSGSIIAILLPDAQEMRIQSRLLLLKARVEMAEGRYADAIRTLETGFSFSRQIAEGPFYINGLVAFAGANVYLDAVPELIERPGAPNLYWALSALPRPLIDLRNQSETEYRMLELEFPDLADLDRPRTASEWDATLARLRKAVAPVMKLDRDWKDKEPLPGAAPDDAADKSPDLPAARKYLTESAGMKADAVAVLPPAQALLLWIGALSREYRDDLFKATYVPYNQARPLWAESNRRLKALPYNEGTRLVKLLLPALEKVQAVQLRTERKVAALRVIEALRLHAAANDGRLPEKLADVTVVPLPDDPGTGQPFEYQRDGATATITSRMPGEPLANTGLRYKVTLRK